MFRVFVCTRGKKKRRGSKEKGKKRRQEAANTTMTATAQAATLAWQPADTAAAAVAA